MEILHECHGMSTEEAMMEGPKKLWIGAEWQAAEKLEDGKDYMMSIRVNVRLFDGKPSMTLTCKDDKGCTGIPGGMEDFLLHNAVFSPIRKAGE